MHLLASCARCAPGGHCRTARSEVRAGAPLRSRGAVQAVAARGLPHEDRSSKRLTPARDAQPGATDALLAPRRLDADVPRHPRRPAVRARDGLPEHRAAARGGAPRPSVYFHLAYQPAAGRVAIEYWFLYLYNDFYDQHEADWEGVTVVLENGTPLGATYSQHQGRKWVPWSALSTTGGHPIAYVARGSHAEYPKPGSYSIKVCWTLHGRHCAPSPRVDAATGSGPTLAPKAYDLQPFGGVGYSGSWGSGNYVLGIGLTQDRITDPRRAPNTQTRSPPFRSGAPEKPLPSVRVVRKVVSSKLRSTVALAALRSCCWRCLGPRPRLCSRRPLRPHSSRASTRACTSTRSPVSRRTRRPIAAAPRPRASSARTSSSRSTGRGVVPGHDHAARRGRARARAPAAAPCS